MFVLMALVEIQQREGYGDCAKEEGYGIVTEGFLYLSLHECFHHTLASTEWALQASEIMKGTGEHALYSLGFSSSRV